MRKIIFSFMIMILAIGLYIPIKVNASQTINFTYNGYNYSVESTKAYNLLVDNGTSMFVFMCDAEMFFGVNNTLANPYSSSRIYNPSYSTDMYSPYHQTIEYKKVVDNVLVNGSTASSSFSWPFTTLVEASETVSWADYDVKLKDQMGNPQLLVFQLPLPSPPPLLQQVAQTVTTESIYGQIISLLPLVIGLLVLVIAFRKAWHFLVSMLHKA